MKKKSLYLFMFLFVQNIFAQQLQFSQVYPSPPAPQLHFDFCPQLASVDYADVDGDNDMDVILSGQSNIYSYSSVYITYKTILYLNDGFGNYTESPASSVFVDVGKGTVDFADVDGDNDPDVLITGKKADDTRTANLYINDGNGNFSLSSSNFTGVSESLVDFADIDGDNDLDVLIAGLGSNNNLITKIYINNGNGYFTGQTGNSFPGFANGSVDFADIDGDNDRDFIISGASPGGLKTKLYTNDGNGNFTEATGVTFPYLLETTSIFFDINNDQNQDLLLTGVNSNDDRITKLYSNDGAGNFTDVTNNFFGNLSISSLDVGDCDNDGDQDILATGRFYNPSTYAYEDALRIFSNDGTGSFSEVFNENLTVDLYINVHFMNINEDDNLDIIANNRLTEVYLNQGNYNFVHVRQNDMIGLRKTVMKHADFDGDNDEDIIMIGEKNGYYFISANLYLNDGNGNYSFMQGNDFPGIKYPAMDVADIDGDNDIDLLIAGTKSSNGQEITILYKNDGTGIFTEVTNTPFPDLDEAAVAFADFNGDNAPDVLISGAYSYNYPPMTKLFLNDGTGNFTEVAGTPFIGYRNAVMILGDVDNDNDIDVLLGGDYDNQTRIYLNDGTGNFTEQTGASPSFPKSGAKGEFVDVDDDNDIDLVISGDYPYYSNAYLYLNDGTGHFTYVQDAFGTTNARTVSIGDVDADNDPDVLIAGSFYTKLFLNDGAGNFTVTNTPDLPDCSQGMGSFIDVDNDNIPDVFLSGYTPCKDISTIFKNTTDIQPVIYINTPDDGQVFTPATTSVNVSITVYAFHVANGTGDGHLQYSINGNTPIDKYDTDPLNLTGLVPGNYDVNFELVDNNGNSLSPPVTASVSFEIPLYTSVSTITELNNPNENYLFTGEAFITARQTYPTGEMVIFAQDATGGIKLKIPDYFYVGNFNRYDGITNIQGILETVNGMKQLNLSESFDLTGNNQVQTPQVVTVNNYLSNPDQYESELIKIENATINPSGDTHFQYEGLYSINDNSGGLQFFVFFSALAGEIIPTVPVNATGIAGHSLQFPQLFSRDINDLEIVSSVATNHIAGLKTYPNPVDNKRVFISSTQATSKQIVIYDIAGKQIFSEEVENNHWINLEPITTGMYIMKIHENQQTAVIKLIVK